MKGFEGVDYAPAKSLAICDPKRVKIFSSDNCRSQRTPEMVATMAEGILENHKKGVRWGILEPACGYLDKDLGAVVLVDGETRRQALLLLMEEVPQEEWKLPVHILTNPELTGKDEALASNARFIASLQANEDSNPLSDMEKAQAILSLGDRGMDDPSIAKVFHRSQAWVKEMKKLLNTHPTIQNAVQSGALPGSAAIKLARLDQEEQAATLQKLKEEGGLITRDRVLTSLREGEVETPTKGRAPALTMSQFNKILDEMIGQQDGPGGTKVWSRFLLIMKKFMAGQRQSTWVKNLDALFLDLNEGKVSVEEGIGDAEDNQGE